MVVPFRNLGAVWGILPVYTTLVLGEMYKSKVSFGHAVGNGFVMLWAGLHWARHLAQGTVFSFKVLPWIVTAVCIGMGVFTIVLGLRRKDKWLCEILGHTRFSCYFIILLYPMQTRLMAWSWTSVIAILVFALPTWFFIYLCGRGAAKLTR